MKRMICFLMLFLMAFCVACSGGQMKEPPAKPVIAPQTPPPIPEEPVYVYANAVVDYLLPISEFSWERLYAPEYVMVHFCSAVVNHPDDPYNLQYVRDTFIQYDVSVHYIVERDGTVRCYIPEDRVAWHAGAGTWLENEKYTNTMNQYAIGIEVIAIGSEKDMAQYITAREYRALDDSLKGYTEAQYRALALLIADICQRNDIPRDADHVIGHQDYSPKKTDPGELFDWGRVLTASLGERSCEPAER